MNKRWG
ncbi:hypothetical protein YPPY63_3121, partial [Yersinia pestis PY-63]